MKKNKIIKFKWEDDKQYNYRTTVSNLSGNVSKALNKLEELAVKANPNYLTVLEAIKSLYGRFVKLDIPEIYQNFHSTYIEGLEYYIKGLEILVQTFREKIEKGLSNKDKMIISKAVKASTLMRAGAAFFEISSIKNMEIFDKQQEEYNKSPKINVTR